mmetsp:Transcript_913/g.1969  ORF Transcript_913/g.1969 Transcript_913/m.1969 type:complete len:239 (-) Transcript_913:128-844(-)
MDGWVHNKFRRSETTRPSAPLPCSLVTSFVSSFLSPGVFFLRFLLIHLLLLFSLLLVCLLPSLLPSFLLSLLLLLFSHPSFSLRHPVLCYAASRRSGQGFTFWWEQERGRGGPGESARVCVFVCVILTERGGESRVPHSECEKKERRLPAVRSFVDECDAPASWADRCARRRVGVCKCLAALIECERECSRAVTHACMHDYDNFHGRLAVLSGAARRAVFLACSVGSLSCVPLFFVLL